MYILNCTVAEFFCDGAGWTIFVINDKKMMIQKVRKSEPWTRIEKTMRTGAHSAQPVNRFNKTTKL